MKHWVTLLSIANSRSSVDTDAQIGRLQQQVAELLRHKVPLSSQSQGTRQGPKGPDSRASVSVQSERNEDKRKTGQIVVRDQRAPKAKARPPFAEILAAPGGFGRLHKRTRIPPGFCYDFQSGLCSNEEVHEVPRLCRLQQGKHSSYGLPLPHTAVGGFVEWSPCRLCQRTAGLVGDYVYSSCSSCLLCWVVGLTELHSWCAVSRRVNGLAHGRGARPKNRASFSLASGRVFLSPVGFARISGISGCAGVAGQVELHGLKSFSPSWTKVV